MCLSGQMGTRERGRKNILASSTVGWLMYVPVRTYGTPLVSKEFPFILLSFLSLFLERGVYYLHVITICNFPGKIVYLLQNNVWTWRWSWMGQHRLIFLQTSILPVIRTMMMMKPQLIVRTIPISTWVPSYQNKHAFKPFDYQPWYRSNFLLLFLFYIIITIITTICVFSKYNVSLKKSSWYSQVISSWQHPTVDIIWFKL